MRAKTAVLNRFSSAIGSLAVVPSVTRIYLMGPMRVINSPDDGNVLPKSKKTQAVLAFLCLSRGARLSRSRVAGIIWDRSEEKQARDSLRHALRDLDELANWKLETDHESILLKTTNCWIDAFEAPGQADLLLQDLHGISSSFDQWLITERSRFEIDWQNKLEKELAESVNGESPPDLRISAARKMLNFLPTHEAAVRVLMKAFEERGDRALAIREYERLRLLLETSQGMQPSEATVRLYTSIRCSSGVSGSSSRRPEAPAEILPILRQVPSQIGTIAARQPQSPSIAVLPLKCLSCEVGHSFIAEGMVEDFVEGLSRVAGLVVMSRLSAAVFRSQDRPLQEISAALGVQYLLSGSIRTSDDRLRLTVELAEGATGLVLWSSRFDETVSNILKMTSQLSDQVVLTVARHIHHTEIKRVRIKRGDCYDAYDLFLRAQDNMHNSSREIFERAGPLFLAAIAREPQYASALAWLAHWHIMRVGQGWSPNPSRDTDQAENFAQKSIECDPTEPMGFAVQGHVAGYLHRNFDLALARFDTALRINPNLGRAWLWSAYVHAWSGNGSRSIENARRAMSLSPYDPLEWAYSSGVSVAYLADGQYERAIEFALRSMGEHRSYTTAYKALILALALSNRKDEARTPIHQLLSLEPDFTVEKFRRRSPAGGGRIGEMFCDALASVGVPLSA